MSGCQDQRQRPLTPTTPTIHSIPTPLPKWLTPHHSNPPTHATLHSPTFECTQTDKPKRIVLSGFYWNEFLKSPLKEEAGGVGNRRKPLKHYWLAITLCKLYVMNEIMQIASEKAMCKPSLDKQLPRYQISNRASPAHSVTTLLND